MAQEAGPAAQGNRRRTADEGKVYADTGETRSVDQRLADALAQQAATSEILRVMAASPAEVQPVLDAIATQAARLCRAPFASVLLAEGAVLRSLAHYAADGDAVALPMHDVPLLRTSITGRATLDGATVHYADVVPVLDTEFPAARENARRTGFRAALAVPLPGTHRTSGAIFLWRREPVAFTPDQVALVATFARQAAIALGNVRQFHAVREALDRQTATSEILRVISRSPTDTTPVFDTIAAAGLRLCRAESVVVGTYDGTLLHVGAIASTTAAGAEAIRGIFPRPAGRDNGITRAVQERRVVSIPDVLADPEYATTQPALASGFRSVLAVPLMRHGGPIGAISLGRADPGAFSGDHVALLETFADQAVIAIENVRLFSALEARNRDLSQALDRETATGEVLRVISESRTDVQPALDAIAAAALKLCDARSAIVTRYDGTSIALAALADVDRRGIDAIRRSFPRPPGRGSATARAILTREVVVIPDVRDDREYTERDAADALELRSVLSVPLLREGSPIGTISAWRAQPGGFSDSLVALLRSFAGQAVIAIENVRLLDELERRNRDLGEALEQQTATSDVLRVMSRSQTDVQPVFETIVASVVKLCKANFANVFTFDGTLIHLAATVNVHADYVEKLRTFFPRPPGRDTAVTRAIEAREVTTIPDVLADPDYAIARDSATGGFRSVLAVPLLREGRAVGGIAVGRPTAGPFPGAQVELLRTFADQAVIAIENARLFDEIGKRNRDLVEALEQQTATSDILRVISRSNADVQPVFDTIVRRARALCKATFSGVYLLEGEILSLVAADGMSADALARFSAGFPRRVGPDTVTGTAALERRVVQTPDLMHDPRYATAPGSRVGARTVLGVPLMRDGVAIGAIGVWRAEVMPFDDAQIALLQTFADQAVIAIENVRLFTELRARTSELTRSVAELRALGEVGRAVSSSLDLATVLSTIVARATALTGMDGGAIYEYDEPRGEFHVYAADRLSEDLVSTLRAHPIRKGEGALGRMAIAGEPVQIADIVGEGSYQSSVRELLVGLGYRALLAVPLMRDDRVLGGLTVLRRAPGRFDEDVMALLRTFAAQSAIAMQNARLFREIEVKSRELELASRHKSEFLANMSHELRTPLNAIIGFSEVLAERMFGEVNDKQAEYLDDILVSARHLLSLINDILDLSKIEAGRMELELGDVDVGIAIDNTVTLVRERAQRRDIRLAVEIPEPLGTIRADERKLKQVLLNLLSNALKFTPEGGRVSVRGVRDAESVEIAVADTGVGIAPQDQALVFEEFRQVGTAAKKTEGTGLGLSISRKFVELHGGTIRVASEPGHGSTFAFRLPRAGPA